MFLIVLFVCTICYHRAVARTKLLHRVFFVCLVCLFFVAVSCLLVCLCPCISLRALSSLRSLARCARLELGWFMYFPPFEKQNTRIQTTRTTKHENTDMKNNKTREYKEQEQQNTIIQTTRTTEHENTKNKNNKTPEYRQNNKAREYRQQEQHKT